MSELTPDVDATDIAEKAEQLWGDGTNLERLPKAVKLFAAAYKGGERNKSAYRLGYAFFSGRGVERANLAKALEFMSVPELERVRFAAYYRGLILSSKDFAGRDEARALAELERAKEMGVAQAAAAIEALYAARSCPICGDKASTSEGKVKRQCPGCNSLERQRVFMSCYRAGMKYVQDLAGARGLVIAASGAEKRLLADLGVAEVVSLDIRPEAHPDVIGDICGRTSLDADSFDFVLASYVLTCVHDVDAALAEIQRVLKPGGVLYTIDPLPSAGATEEISDLKLVTSHYGQENYDRYKVGAFRRLGRLGLTETLAKRFSVLIHDGGDPITGQSMAVFSSRKDVQDAVRRAEVDGFIAQNAENERLADCGYSRQYEAAKAADPNLSYAHFAVAKEVAAVGAFGAHATLGKNITEGSRIQGDRTYRMYADLLDIQPDHHVVEYGCGSLRVGLGFIRDGKIGRYFGLDVMAGFYELGREMVGEELIKEKAVRLHVIDEEGVREAAEFGARHAYASAVIFHIHPDDVRQAMSNLARIAGAPGAKLIFDAKVTRDDKPARYPQKDGKGGWAWPLSFYKAALAPLELVAVHGRMAYDWAPEVDFAHLEFRAPFRSGGLAADRDAVAPVAAKPVVAEPVAIKPASVTPVAAKPVSAIVAAAAPAESRPRAASSVRGRRKLMLTVDVEAQTGRASQDHVNRLIWGRFPEGQAGIGEMMDVAERRGARLTMFLDWAETDLYSDAIRHVGREIHHRGHDLELHVHADFFAPDFWTRSGIARQFNLNLLDEDQASAIAEELVARHVETIGQAPVAFRGGGYRYCAPLLKELNRRGVVIDSSVNVARKTQPVSLGASKQFNWTGGPLEIPISCVQAFGAITYPLEFNFNSGYFAEVARMQAFLRSFWRERGNDAVAVLVMHSWSLLKLGADGNFEYNGQGDVERFDAFLSGLPDDVEIVTARDIVDAGPDELPTDDRLDLDKTFEVAAA